MYVYDWLVTKKDPAAWAAAVKDTALAEGFDAGITNRRGLPVLFVQSTDCTSQLSAALDVARGEVRFKYVEGVFTPSIMQALVSDPE